MRKPIKYGWRFYWDALEERTQFTAIYVTGVLVACLLIFTGASLISARDELRKMRTSPCFQYERRMFDAVNARNDGRN